MASGAFIAPYFCIRCSKKHIIISERSRGLGGIWLSLNVKKWKRESAGRCWTRHHNLKTNVGEWYPSKWICASLHGIGHRAYTLVFDNGFDVWKSLRFARTLVAILVVDPLQELKRALRTLCTELQIPSSAKVEYADWIKEAQITPFSKKGQKTHRPNVQAMTDMSVERYHGAWSLVRVWGRNVSSCTLQRSVPALDWAILHWRIQFRHWEGFLDPADH